MSNGLGWYKRFPRDFLEGTIGMSLEEKGSYSILLDLIYARNGSLPDDARFIAGTLGCSVRKWNAIRLVLIERGKITVENGFISNLRANYLLENARKVRDKNDEKQTATNENNNLDGLARVEPEPEPEPDVIDDGNAGAKIIADDWPDLKGPDLLDRITKDIGSRWIDPSKATGLVTTLVRWAAWKREGVGYAEAVAVVVAVAARKAEPITTWKYFDAAIARALADRVAGLENVGGKNEQRDRYSDKRKDELNAVWTASESACRG